MMKRIAYTTWQLVYIHKPKTRNPRSNERTPSNTAPGNKPYKLNQMNNVKQIEEALKLHTDYKGKPSNGNYLKKMDVLAMNYKGSLSQKVSGLLNDYYRHVGVKNLDEALKRLKAQEQS